MTEPAQVRAARALIGWSQAQLADAAGVAAPLIERFESCEARAAPAGAIEKIQAALEKAGVAFIAKNGGGVGVRLSKGADAQYLGWNDLTAANDD
jgi:transcriptional regulator with XRE-family HTH domain